MARYSVTFAGTLDTSLDFGYTIGAASNPRRHKWYDLTVGSSATPADNPFLWSVNKRTAAGGTPVPVTPQTLDDTDSIASTVVSSSKPASNGAGSGRKLTIPLNQRATYRWVAAPGSELVVPATASQGLALSGTTGSAVACDACVLFIEE